jgi:plasmid replication initiation protein
MDSSTIDNLTVVHSNDLIEASYGQSIDELRLINLALTKINSQKENPGVINVSPEEFSKMFSLKDKNIWRNMKNAVDRIMSKPVKIYRLDDKGKETVTNITWLVESEYYSNQEDGTKISIEFSPKITPYLFEIKDRFTSLNFEYACRLTTPFSYRLYSWLMEFKNLNKNKEGGTIKVELENSWMMERANIKGDYERWSNFKSRVIEPAVAQINAKTDISVIWRGVKSGRGIKSICFNYAFEDGAVKMPVRPRLLRRPKVKTDTHAEAAWMRGNLNLLVTYKDELAKYNKTAKITIADLKKMVEYAKKTGHTMRYESLSAELNERSRKT